MNLKQIKLPENGSTYLSHGLFFNCPIENIEIPESVIEVRDNCFNGNNFKTFIIPNRFSNSIRLSNCKLLESVIFEEGNDDNQLIIYSTFLSGCDKLKYLVLPKRTTTIYQNALGYTNPMKDLYIKAPNPPVLLGSLGGAIERIYIPVGTIDAYSSATNWSSIASKFIEYDFDENPHGVF